MVTTRREFLRLAGGAAGAMALAHLHAGRAIAAEPATIDVRDFFESTDPEVLTLTQRVFDKCIFDKLRSPTDPLLHTWFSPAGRITWANGSGTRCSSSIC